MSNQSVRAIVVEDETLYRELLAVGLSRDPGLHVVGTFASGDGALGEARVLAPDVALLDIELGGRPDGLQTGLLLRRMFPEIGLVLLSNHAQPRLLTALPAEEAHGWSYLLKRSNLDMATLHQATKNAAAGRVTIDPVLVARRYPQEEGPLGRLSRRQLDIVELLATGLSNDEIALRLRLARRTVENQLSHIYHKLDLARSAGEHPRVAATLLYLAETHEDHAVGTHPPSPDMASHVR